jgi:hypothetical protein
MDLIAHVSAHAGLDVDARTVDGVLAALGARLSDATRSLVASELAAEQARALAGGALASRTDRELVASVCHALAESLSDDALGAIRRELPALAGLFESAPALELEGRPTGRTLAGARPGSAHPLAMSRPPGAQAGSVGDENPHGDTKLSSGASASQESIAEGTGGSKRPIH